MVINQLLKRMSDFYPPLQSGDLLLCAKHLFVTPRWLDLSQPSKARSTQKNSAFSSTAASRFAIA